MFDSVFGKSFNSGKCKTLLKLAMSRIKLLRNKRDIQLKQMKRELAQLLQTNQEASARIRVEHVYREQNIMAAYEIIELFCELIVVRLPIIESQRQCPIDLREAVASLIFAAPRCADLPEMQQVRNLFGVKYGKEFVAGAAELRPDCGVNRLIIEKLSVRAPSGEAKLQLMKEIAAEQSVEWDPTASESELLKAPEDLLEGSSRFLGASQMPLQTPSEKIKMKDSVEERNGEKVIAESQPSMFKEPDVSLGEKQYIPFVLPVPGDTVSQGINQSPSLNVKVHSPKGSFNPSSVDADLKIEEITDDSAQSEHHQRLEVQGMSFSSSSKRLVQQSSGRDESFKDVTAAARAAAESAERAVAAARAAASLANGSNRKSDKSTSESSSDSDDTDDFKKGLQSVGRPSEKYFKIHANSFNQQVGDERPLFDEYVEDRSSGMPSGASTRKQQSWNKSSSCEDQLDSFSKHENRSLYSKKWQYQEDALKSESMKITYSESGGADPYFDASLSSFYQRQRSTMETQVSDATDSQPPQRPPPNLPGNDHIGGVKPAFVHPKLPDYDDLAARFESLRSERS